MISEVLEYTEKDLFEYFNHILKFTEYENRDFKGLPLWMKNAEFIGFGNAESECNNIKLGKCEIYFIPNETDTNYITENIIERKNKLESDCFTHQNGYNYDEKAEKRKTTFKNNPFKDIKRKPDWMKRGSK